MGNWHRWLCSRKWRPSQYTRRVSSKFQSVLSICLGFTTTNHIELTNLSLVLQDARFNRDIDLHTGYRTKALLCMPIKDSSGDVIGVAQVINKLNCERFTENDEKVICVGEHVAFSFVAHGMCFSRHFIGQSTYFDAIFIDFFFCLLQIFSSYLQFCGIGLRNAQLYEKSQLEVKRNQVLLDLARMIFEEQSTIEHMVLRILTHMQSLIQCQRVQVSLLNHLN